MEGWTDVWGRERGEREQRGGGERYLQLPRGSRWRRIPATGVSSSPQTQDVLHACRSEKGRDPA